MREKKVQIDNKEQLFTLILHYTHYLLPNPDTDKSNVIDKPQFKRHIDIVKCRLEHDQFFFHVLTLQYPSNPSLYCHGVSKNIGLFVYTIEFFIRHRDTKL